MAESPVRQLPIKRIAPLAFQKSKDVSTADVT